MTGCQTRREFIRRGLAAGSATALLGSGLLGAGEKSSGMPPIVVFSKVYQELKLSFAESAELTAEAGLAGVDCTVRPGGEVLPERAEDELPRYAEALQKRGLGMPLLTSAIVAPSSPNTEQILRTAKKLGVRWYRLGFVLRDSKLSAAEQINQWKPQLKELAELNKRIGLGAVIQNHSPAGQTVYLAGDLGEMKQLVEGLDPEQIGVAFDIAHAIAVHGSGWRAQFDALQKQFKIAYVKDVTREREFVRFGQGEIGRSGYFPLLKQMGYQGPFSLHIEFEWAREGEKNRAGLLKALKESAAALRGWMA